jgi:hypothetical protein
VNHEEFFSKQHDPETTWIHDGALSKYHDPADSGSGDAGEALGHDGFFSAEHDPATSWFHDGLLTRWHDPTLSLAGHNPVDSFKHDPEFSAEHDPQTTWSHDGLGSRWHSPDVSDTHYTAISVGHDASFSADHVASTSVLTPTEYTDQASDFIIDADGTSTSGDGLPAKVETPAGATIVSFESTVADISEDVRFVQGQSILWYDSDLNGKWSSGDDLVLEQGVNDTDYDLGTDLVILDANNSLSDGLVGTAQLQGIGGLLRIYFYDADSDGGWDTGEDIIVDVNGDGDYDPA